MSQRKDALEDAATHIRFHVERLRALQKANHSGERARLITRLLKIAAEVLKL